MEISAKAFDDIPGREPGSRCPACKKGKLLPVIETQSGDNGIMGPDGRSWCRSYISRLACSSCSTCFEVAKEYRGLELHQHLEEQLKTFESPSDKPTVCRHCKRPLTEGMHYADHGTLYFSDTDDGTPYLYCDVCFKVHWFEKREPKHLDHDGP